MGSLSMEGEPISVRIALVPDRPAPPQRADSSEIVALRRLREEQPELASAIDLQIELLQIQRRIQTRVPLPSINLETTALNALLADGPILRFEQLPIEWSDVRFLLRATAQAMRKHDAIEEVDVMTIGSIGLTRFAGGGSSILVLVSAAPSDSRAVWRGASPSH